MARMPPADTRITVGAMMSKSIELRANRIELQNIKNETEKGLDGSPRNGLFTQIQSEPIKPAKDGFGPTRTLIRAKISVSHSIPQLDRSERPEVPSAVRQPLGRNDEHVRQARRHVAQASIDLVDVHPR